MSGLDDITESRREQLLRLTLDSAEAAIWDVDLIARTTTGDARFFALLDLPAGGTVPTDAVLDRVHPDDRERVIVSVREAAARRDVGLYRCEFRTAPGGGGSRWLDVQGRVIRERDGTAVQMLGILFDATERHQNRQALADARLRSDVALTAGSVATYTWDIPGNRVYGDESLGQLFGLTPGPHGSYPLADYVAAIHADDRPATVARIEHTLRTGEPYEAEYRVGRGERERWVVARGRVVPGDDGKPVSFTGVIIDITAQVLARQHAEQLGARLQQNEERLRLVVEAAGAGLWEVNLATHEVSGDERFRTIYGLDPGEPFDIDRALARMTADDQAHVARSLDDALTGKHGGRYRVEHRIQHANGVSWMEARGQVFLDATGRPARFVGTAVDITARKQIEQERERLLSELTRSNTALDQFAHVASHDLKAPLRGIANLSQWIEDDLGDAITDDARDKLGLMRGRVQQLERMINGILDYATAGSVRVQPETIDVSKLLTDVVELLAPPAHLTLTVAHPLPTLRADRVALQQVVMNLLGNAIKHTQQTGAVIEVAGRDEGEFVHLTITDNGPGIDPRDHERIWGLFQKGPHRGKVEGSGIGLAVVKKTVESRGGRVWVESALGQGATFHVLWPRSTTASLPR